MWTKLITAVFPPIAKIIDQAVEDKDEANRLKTQIHSQLLDMKAEETRLATSVIIAEAQGESWLQRNWRPTLMLTIVAIVANNYLIYPYLSLFGAPATVLELPEHLYTLMTTGVGGYIVGRSGEKIAKAWKGEDR